MKTAEEWRELFTRVFNDHPPKSSEDYIAMRESFIESVQLDAFKAGMGEAASLIHPKPDEYFNPVELWLGLHDANLVERLEQAILTARDKKESV